MKRKSLHYSIGLDLGGTKLSSALVDSQGTILHERKDPSLKTKKGLISLLSSHVEYLKNKLPKERRKKIKGIGLASAGPLNVERKELVHATHFPKLKVFPIVAFLQNELKRKKIPFPIYFQNDAMAGALGEGWIGKAKTLKTYALITLGTGIGSGVIYKGEPLQYRGMGGEWGLGLIHYEKIKSSTENPYYASIEGLSSGNNISRQAKDLGFSNHSAKELVEEIKKGNMEVKELFQNAALALAMLSHNLCLALHVEKIIFTGGLMEASSYFFPEIKKNYKVLMKGKKEFQCSLEKSQLKNKAGVLGAARLSFLEA